MDKKILAIILGLLIVYGCGLKSNTAQKQQALSAANEVAEITVRTKQDVDFFPLTSAFSELLSAQKKSRFAELRAANTEQILLTVENAIALVNYFIANAGRFGLNSGEMSDNSTVIEARQTIFWARNNLSALNDYSRALQQEKAKVQQIASNAKILLNYAEQELAKKRQGFETNAQQEDISRAQLRAYYESSPNVQQTLQNYSAYTVADLLAKAQDAYADEITNLQITQEPRVELGGGYINPETPIEYDQRYYLADWLDFIDISAGKAVSGLHDLISRKDLAEMIEAVPLVREDVRIFGRYREKLIRDNIIAEELVLYNLLHTSITTKINTNYIDDNNNLAALRREWNASPTGNIDAEAYRAQIAEVERHVSETKVLEDKYKKLIIEVIVNDEGGNENERQAYVSSN